MNLFDIIILFILSLCLIRGIFIGFIRGLFSTIGVLFGFCAASKYYPEIANLLFQWMPNAACISILSILTIFCGVMFIFSTFGVIIRYIFNLPFPAWLDRFIGAGFGITKGILFISVLIIILNTSIPESASINKDSLLSTYVTPVSKMMVKIAPGDMKLEGCSEN